MEELSVALSFLFLPETKEESWQMSVYLWLVPGEAGQQGFVASEVQ